MLIAEEMERKFVECGMDEILKTCKPKRTNRDPNISTNPPHTSVVHKREHGVQYTHENGDFVALVFYWDEPTGEPRRSIRAFTCPDGKPYRLRIGAPPLP